MQIFKTLNTHVNVLDDPDQEAGGACHEYEITADDGTVLGKVSFQHGPVGEKGVNGVQHVDLLAIIQHRLDSFQRGPFSSAVNEVTCGFVGGAIVSEGIRTRRREVAGVEGTSRKAAGVEMVK